MLTALVDDSGNSIKVGEQKDVGEFNINLLARVHDALEIGKGSIGIPTKRDPTSQREFDRSIALGMSTLLPVAPEDLCKSFIYNTFFGSSQIITKATDRDGKKIELKTEAAFGQVIVNAQERDIYKGWEANYYSEIDDFQTQSVLIAYNTR